MPARVSYPHAPSRATAPLPLLRSRAAIEKQWATQEDEKLLRRLLGKIRTANAPAAGVKSEEAKRLDVIVGAC